MQDDTSYAHPLADVAAELAAAPWPRGRRASRPTDRRRSGPRLRQEPRGQPRPPAAPRRLPVARLPGRRRRVAQGLRSPLLRGRRRTSSAAERLPGSLAAVAAAAAAGAALVRVHDVAETVRFLRMLGAICRGRRPPRQARARGGRPVIERLRPLGALSRLSFTWRDAVDILVVAVIVYSLLRLIRGTRAVQMVVRARDRLPPLRDRRLRCSSRRVRDRPAGLIFYLPFAIIVLFAQELRRALAAFGRTPLFAWFSGYHAEETISDIVLAVDVALGPARRRADRPRAPRGAEELHRERRAARFRRLLRPARDALRARHAAPRRRRHPLGTSASPRRPASSPSRSRKALQALRHAAPRGDRDHRGDRRAGRRRLRGARHDLRRPRRTSSSRTSTARPCGTSSCASSRRPPEADADGIAAPALLRNLGLEDPGARRSRSWSGSSLSGERRERISERSYRIPLSVANIPPRTIIASPLAGRRGRPRARAVHRAPAARSRPARGGLDLQGAARASGSTACAGGRQRAAGGRGHRDLARGVRVRARRARRRRAPDRPRT